ncbi:hypothetical protein V8C26DRAFT_295910 [Trichoderma gracile]
MHACVKHRCLSCGSSVCVVRPDPCLLWIFMPSPCMIDVAYKACPSPSSSCVSCLFPSAASSSLRPCASIPLTRITWPPLVLVVRSRRSGADSPGLA